MKECGDDSTFGGGIVTPPDPMWSHIGKAEWAFCIAAIMLQLI